MIKRIKDWWHHLLHDDIASRPAFIITGAEGHRRSSAALSRADVEAKYGRPESKQVTNYGPENVQAHFVGGRVGGMKVELTKTPSRVVVAGQTYDRVDDPDTGEYLGAYSLHYEGDCCDD